MVNIDMLKNSVRTEGFNCGIPITFVELGDGDASTKIEDLVGQIYRLATSSRWVCIRFGSSEYPVGTGTLIRGLAQCQLKVEVCCDGSWPAPGWIKSAERWCIDYLPDTVFDLGSLRPQDMVRFKLGLAIQLPFIESSFKELKTFPGLRYIRCEVDPELWLEGLSLISRFDRARLYPYSEGQF